AASRAVNVTVVGPGGKIAGALLETRTEPLTLSDATGIGTATDVPVGPVCSTVVGGGTPLNVGGVVSTTVTTVAADALLPGALLETATEPLQLSEDVGIGSKSVAPDGPDCSIVVGEGTPLKVGAVTSRTVTTTVSDAVPPCPSATVSMMV